MTPDSTTRFSLATLASGIAVLAGFTAALAGPFYPLGLFVLHRRVQDLHNTSDEVAWYVVFKLPSSRVILAGLQYADEQNAVELLLSLSLVFVVLAALVTSVRHPHALISAAKNKIASLRNRPLDAPPLGSPHDVPWLLLALLAVYASTFLALAVPFLAVGSYGYEIDFTFPPSIILLVFIGIDVLMVLVDKVWTLNRLSRSDHIVVTAIIISTVFTAYALQSYDDTHDQRVLLVQLCLMLYNLSLIVTPILIVLRMSLGTLSRRAIMIGTLTCLTCALAAFLSDLIYLYGENSRHQVSEANVDTALLPCLLAFNCSALVICTLYYGKLVNSNFLNRLYGSVAYVGLVVLFAYVFSLPFASGGDWESEFGLLLASAVSVAALGYGLAVLARSRGMLRMMSLGSVTIVISIGSLPCLSFLSWQYLASLPGRETLVGQPGYVPWMYIASDILAVAWLYSGVVRRTRFVQIVALVVFCHLCVSIYDLILTSDRSVVASDAVFYVVGGLAGFGLFLVAETGVAQRPRPALIAVIMVLFVYFPALVSTYLVPSFGGLPAAAPLPLVAVCVQAGSHVEGRVGVSAISGLYPGGTRVVWGELVAHEGGYWSLFSDYWSPSATVIRGRPRVYYTLFPGYELTMIRDQRVSAAFTFSADVQPPSRLPPACAA